LNRKESSRTRAFIAANFWVFTGIPWIKHWLTWTSRTWASMHRRRISRLLFNFIYTISRQSQATVTFLKLSIQHLLLIKRQKHQKGHFYKLFIKKGFFCNYFQEGSVFLLQSAPHPSASTVHVTRVTGR